MKKNKEILFIFIISLILFNIFFIKSLETNTSDQKAISCLKSKVSGKCNNINTEEKIFSLLSVGECKSELKADSVSGNCWPGASCNVKTTAKAIIALKNSGENTLNAENWINERKIPFESLDWYLQINTDNKSNCTVEYNNQKYSFKVLEDQSISSLGLGSCLFVSDSYWLKISSSCLKDNEFIVSCDKPFSTSLIFKKKNSDYFFILLNIHYGQSEGYTKEKPLAYCIREEGTSSCNYESTLWTALAMNFVGKNISDYLAYLISMADQNNNYLPESFLYTLTGNYKDDLLNKQTTEGYWQVSNDKFYDTALALLPFQNDDTIIQKTKAKEWLEKSQQANGCWRDDIIDTGFLVYSLWSKRIIPVSSNNCINSGYFCTTNSESCNEAGGNVLNEYTGCNLGSVCCDKQEIQKNCSEKSGVLCFQNQTCNGVITSSLDSLYGKSCCIGTCINAAIPTDGGQEGEGNEGNNENICKNNGGSCKQTCSKEEIKISDPCLDSNEVCCIKEEKKSSILLILILGILILLLIFGFIFKNKLRLILSPLLSKIGKKNKLNKGIINQNIPSSKIINKTIPINNKEAPSSRTYPGAVPRKVIIPNSNSQNAPINKNSVNNSQKSKEVEDVLKKLKEMSK
jgi:hypothetical protein